MAGDSSDTRADRLIYSTANITASEVAAKLGCSLEDAEAAVVRANARRAGHAHYSTTDAHYEDVPNRDDGETFIGPRPASSHEIYRMYDCFSRYKLAPHLRLHEATSRQIDDLDLATDKKAAARLKLKGARKYAQWLVNRERRIAEKHTALQDTNHWLYGQLWRDPNIAEERKLWLEQTEAARRKRKRKSAKLKLIRCEELDARADRPQDTRPFNERSKVA